ncbi:MAG: phosphatase PAP2 family protein [Caulobacteraceae bacterium]|nr:phosphatase PAP2 family protein [Caulobacteraceae bacterium]
MFRPTVLLVAAAIVVGAAPAFGQTPAGAMNGEKPHKALIYLTPADIDPARLLPPPPADGSTAAQADLSAVKQIMAARTPERLARARWDDEHEDPSAFNATLGAGYDVKAMPATAAVMQIVQLDAGIAASAAKRLFARKRPWAVDPSIVTCDPNDKPLTSYPSGHATMGYAVAMTYAVLAPEKAQALMARAADYATSREVCGAHYGSDTAASAALSAAVVTALLKDPRFQAKLQLARSELRAAKVTAQ